MTYNFDLSRFDLEHLEFFFEEGQGKIFYSIVGMILIGRLNLPFIYEAFDSLCSRLRK